MKTYVSMTTQQLLEEAHSRDEEGLVKQHSLAMHGQCEIRLGSGMVKLEIPSLSELLPSVVQLGITTLTLGRHGDR